MTNNVYTVRLNNACVQYSLGTDMFIVKPSTSMHCWSQSENICGHTDTDIYWHSCSL